MKENYFQLIVATFISYIFQWHETYGAPVVGKVPTGYLFVTSLNKTLLFWTASARNSEFFPDARLYGQRIGHCNCYNSDSYIHVKNAGKKDELRKRFGRWTRTIRSRIQLYIFRLKFFDAIVLVQEHLLLLFLGFFPVFPTSTALGRTMVNVESGAKTQVAIFIE